MKKLLVMVLSVASAAVAQASYLYWQTGTEETFNGHQIYGYQIKVTDGNTTKTLTPTYPDDAPVVALEKGGYASDSEYKINLGDAYDSDAYSFYVEVLGYDSAIFGDGVVDVIGATEKPLNYSQMVSNNYIVPSGLTKIPTMWTGGPVSAPEPTSAVLMLLGLAGLALKRRKI